MSSTMAAYSALLSLISSKAEWLRRYSSHLSKAAQYLLAASIESSSSNRVSVSFRNPSASLSRDLSTNSS